MYHGYAHEPGSAVSRPRGKSPQQAAFFTRSPKLQEESSLLASVCCLLGVLPRAGVPENRHALVTLSRGELLCQAFEVYRELVPDPRISFEHLVLLVSALAGGEELAMVNCELCGALTVVERFKTRRCRVAQTPAKCRADSSGHGSLNGEKAVAREGCWLDNSFSDEGKTHGNCR
jgi:hypothetical protein